MECYERLNNAFSSWQEDSPASLEQRVETIENNVSILTTDVDNIETSLATKQDIISDLSEIRSGAAAGATAVQQTTFETDQQRQETEIGVVANAGAKNNFNINTTPTVNHTTYTLTDGKLTVNANGNWAHYSVPIDLPEGDYILSTVISDYDKVSEAPDTSMRLRISATTSGGTNIALQTITGNGTVSVPFTWTGGMLYLQFYSDYNATAYTNSFSAENVMIRRAEITDSTFAPYAPTNRELYEMILALQNGT